MIIATEKERESRSSEDIGDGKKHSAFLVLSGNGFSQCRAPFHVL